MTLRLRVYVTAFLFAASGSGLLAQSERGAISGTVRDSSGAVIPHVKVTVTETATGTVTTSLTNESGEYTIPNLAVGTYNVDVLKEGFRPQQVTGLVLNAGGSLRSDVTLQVGNSTQSVEVQAYSVAVNTENAVTQTAVTNQLVDELPLVVSGAMRSAFDLATLTPEAKAIGGTTGYALGGGQAASYGTNLDGVSTNTTRALHTDWISYNQPSLEAITEFSVETNGFKAEYGHAGGGVMSFATKSGTNLFHGSAYEFLRNNDLDANNFFNNRAGLPVPIYKQNDFGASVGGPVWIPKIYKGKNKTFFFFAYEGFRNRAGSTGTATTIPTPEMYTGDFHNWVNAAGQMIPIYDPNGQTSSAGGAVTRTPFAGNQIPQSEFDSISAKILSAYSANGILKPNNGGQPGTVAYVQNNYILSSGSQISPQNKWSIKGDHSITDKQRISFFFLGSKTTAIPGPDGPPTLPGLYANYNDGLFTTQVYRLGYDYAIRPNLFNHFYAGGNNWVEDHNGPQATPRSGIHWKDKVCVPNVPNCDDNLFQVGFGSNSYTTWGSIADNGSDNIIVSFNDDLTWVKGRHVFKFGATHQDLHYNGFGQQCEAGCATFVFNETGLPGNTNFTQAGGNPFASFLLGYADSGSLDSLRYIGQQWSYFAGYVQDDFRVRPNLTLNLGFRYDVTLAPTFAFDHMSDFSPTTPNPQANNIPGALIFAGNCDGCQGSSTLADTWYGGWQPRLGFAYSPHDKWVVRGGYARTFGAVTTISGSTHQVGFVAQPSFNNGGSNGVTPSFRLQSGFPYWPQPPDIDPSYANGAQIPWYQGVEATRAPEANNWNLSVQRQVSSTMVVEGSYNGVVGSHLVAGLLQYNQVNPIYLQKYGATLLSSLITSPAAVAAGIPMPYANFVQTWTSGGTCKCTVAQALKPFPQFASIDTAAGGGDHSGHSSYHAATVQVSKRAGGLTLQASYVLSKLLTNADSYAVGGAAMDFYNRGLEKSIGSFDITHNVKITQVYNLPFGKGHKYLASGIGAWIAGGWRIASAQYYASGQPLAVTTGLSLPLGGGNLRPTVPGYDGWYGFSGSFDPSVNRFVQPASFFGPQTATFGNETRYNPKFRQFANLNENVSVAKTFTISEAFRFDLRAEAFNVFNRVRFGTGSLSLQSTTFGLLQSASDLLNTPRQLQVAAKFYF